MLTQTGVVTALLPPDQDQAQRQALIQVLPLSACERCASGQGCGAGLFSRLLRMRPAELKLPVAKDANVGQTVWLVMDETQLTRQAWRWYGVPVLGFLLGAALPALLWQQASSSSTGPVSMGQDAASLAGGLLLLMIAWIAARWLQRPQPPRVLLNSPCGDQS